MNANILGISELTLTGGANLIQMAIISTTVGRSLRRNGVAIIDNKRVQNVVLGCNLKNYSMISVHFQCKPFNITVIQAYAPTTNAKKLKLKSSLITYKI